MAMPDALPPSGAVRAADELSIAQDAIAQEAQSSQAAFDGFVDGLSHLWRVVGWARPLLPDIGRLHVRLMENGEELDSAVADMFRGDLLGAMIGDGKYGFSLKIPARLFDGLRHTLLVCAAGLPGPGMIGKLDVALPNRAASKAPGLGGGTASDLLHAILPPRRAQENDADARAAELTETLQAIAQNFDHATALGCLYVHVLRRRIDQDGLQTRLTRLSNSPAELATVVREVLASEEARHLYKPGAAYRFPDISALRIWTRLRRFT